MEDQNIEGTNSQSMEVVEEDRGREVFKKFLSKVMFHEMVACTREYHLPWDYRVYIPSENSHVTYPPTDFVAINSQHLESGFRFPVAPYILSLLNELKLAPFQLIPNSYSQLTSLTLLFLRNHFSSPSQKLVKFLFFFKSAKDRLYYLAVRPSQYKTILP